MYLPVKALHVQIKIEGHFGKIFHMKPMSLECTSMEMFYISKQMLKDFELSLLHMRADRC